MTVLLEEAIEKAKKLPQSQQDAIAQMILDEMESERKWDEQFAKSPEKLARLAEQARHDYEAGRTQPLNPENPITNY